MLGAAIIPRGGSLYALPVQLSVASRAGFDLSPFSTMMTDQLLSYQPICSIKLQDVPPGEWKPLGPPVRLFHIDWADAPLEDLLTARESELEVRISRKLFIVYE